MKFLVALTYLVGSIDAHRDRRDILIRTLGFRSLTQPDFGHLATSTTDSTSTDSRQSLEQPTQISSFLGISIRSISKLSYIAAGLAAVPVNLLKVSDNVDMRNSFTNMFAPILTGSDTLPISSWICSTHVRISTVS
jgi:hypothetical protein